MKNLFDLKGRDIWVVGGAGYLGTATVKQLISSEANVLCGDIGTKAAEQATREKFGSTFTPVDLGSGDSTAMQKLAEEQLAQRGTPDGLVVMTYRSFPQAMQDLTAEQFDDANRTITSTFILARAVGEAMAKAGRGSIVLFSSMYGTVAPKPAMYPAPIHPNSIEYGVGKAGIQGMARYFATHYAPRNVRCNSISPGAFPFPSTQRDQPVFHERLQSRCPMGRVGQSEEIAGSVHFLLADASSYVTGINLAVDGGWTAW